MLQLPDVKQNIEPVLASVSYTDGNKYGDFNPELDEVAAWTIGGLVAGKVLAKAGIFALLLKNLKADSLGNRWPWNCEYGDGIKRKLKRPTVRKLEG